MASFDFVDSASKGYKFFWDERRAIIRLAAIPFAVKLFSFVAVTGVDFSSNYLRQGLFLLPSHCAEGWLVMQIIRFAVLGERGHARLTGDSGKDKMLASARSRGVIAGTIIYVLVKLFLSLTSALFLMGGEARKTITPAEVSDIQAFVVGTAFLMLMIWGFRFLWLYIPAALDRPVLDFLQRIKPFTSSFSMIGAWLLSFVPTMLLLIVLSEVLVTFFPGSAENQPSEVYKYGMAVIQSLLDLVIAVISSLGMAYGIQTIYDGTNKATPIL